MSKRLTIAQYGFVDIPTDVPLETAIKYLKENAGEVPISWDPINWDNLSVVEANSPVASFCATRKRGDCIPWLVTLQRVRPNHTLKDQEVHEDYFLFWVPKHLYLEKGTSIDWAPYFEDAFRQAAQTFLLGPAGPKAISNSCADFNWGDFVLELDNDAYRFLESQGCPFCPPAGSAYFDWSHRVTVRVMQDEVLLPYGDDLKPHIIVTNKDGAHLYAVETVADFATGEVFSADFFIALDDHSLFIDFGNGVRHPLAKKHDEQDGENGVYFYLGN